MTGVTNEYLTKLGNKLFGKTFLGSFPCDYKPTIKNKHNFSVIFNLSKHDEKGSHFVAVYCKRKNIVYFDPFGEPCTNEFIINFIKDYSNGKNYIENNTTIQSCQSYFCGLFCICFIAYLKEGFSLKDFLKLFNKKNLLKNDVIVTKYIIKFILK